MAMAQEFEFEPWPPDGVGKSGRLIRQPRPRGCESRLIVHCAAHVFQAKRIACDLSPGIGQNVDRSVGLAFGDRIAECQGTKNPQDKSFRPKDRTGAAT